MRASSSTHARAQRLRSDLSLPEKLLWVRLRRRDNDRPTFRRQHPLGPFILDFYCANVRLCIEIDGAMHHIGDRPERDARRDAWLREQQIDVVRIPASYVLSDPDTAADYILTLAEARRAASRRV